MSEADPYADFQSSDRDEAANLADIRSCLLLYGSDGIYPDIRTITVQR